MLLTNKDEMSGRAGWILSERGSEYNSGITGFCNNITNYYRTYVLWNIKLVA